MPWVSVGAFTPDMVTDGLKLKTIRRLEFNFFVYLFIQYFFFGVGGGGEEREREREIERGTG